MLALPTHHHEPKLHGRTCHIRTHHTPPTHNAHRLKRALAHTSRLTSFTPGVYFYSNSILAVSVWVKAGQSFRFKHTVTTRKSAEFVWANEMSEKGNQSPLANNTQPQKTILHSDPGIS